MQTDYKEFLNKKGTLLKLISESGRIFNRLNLKLMEGSIAKLEERVKSEYFKLMVLGEFNAGKSTFINAFLGSEILPTDPLPCTAIINEIKWGEKKQAFLRFKNPLPSSVPEGLPSIVASHIKKNGESPVPPLEVPYESLVEFVTIKDPANPKAEMDLMIPYNKIELFWPFDIGKESKGSIKIIDSPGINESKTHNDITTTYLPNVDAVIFLISCDSPVSKNELAFIDNYVRGAGHEYIFFVLNKFDIVEQSNKESFMSYVRGRLRDRTKLKDESIFFICASCALDGYIENDKKLIEESGILELTDKLDEFLLGTKSRVKLMAPAGELGINIRRVRNDIIPAQNAMLEQGFENLQKKYSRIEPKLLELENRKKQIVDKIELYKETIMEQVKNVSVIRLREIVDKIPQWMDETELDKKISYWKITNIKKQAEAIANEAGEKIQERIKDEQSEWSEKVLQPMVDTEMKRMEDDLGIKVGEFYVELDKVIDGLVGRISGEQIGIRNVPAWERLVAAAGGLVLGGISASLVGGFMGIKSALKNLGIQISLAVTLIVIGIANPLVLFPILCIPSVFQMIVGSRNMDNRVKTTIGIEIAKGVKEKIYEEADKIASESTVMFDEFKERIEAGLEKEIQSVKEQIESALDELNKGRDKIEEKRKELNNINSEAVRIDNELANLIMSIGMQ